MLSTKPNTEQLAAEAIYDDGQLVASVIEKGITEETWRAARSQVESIPETYTAGFFDAEALPVPIKMLVREMHAVAEAINQPTSWNRFTINVNRPVDTHIDNHTDGASALVLFRHGSVEGGNIKIGGAEIELAARSVLIARFDIYAHSVTPIQLHTKLAARRSFVTFHGRNLVP